MPGLYVRHVVSNRAANVRLIHGREVSNRAATVRLTWQRVSNSAANVRLIWQTVSQYKGS
jgi:hypothetical protein